MTCLPVEIDFYTYETSRLIGGGKVCNNTQLTAAGRETLSLALSRIGLAAHHEYDYKVGDCYFDSLEYLTGVPSDTIRTLAVEELRQALKHADETALHWLITHIPESIHNAPAVSIRRIAEGYWATMGTPASAGDLSAWADNVIAHWAGKALTTKIQCHRWEAATGHLHSSTFGDRNSTACHHVLFTGPTRAGHWWCLHYTPCTRADEGRHPACPATSEEVRNLHTQQQHRWPALVDEDTIKIRASECLANGGSMRSPQPPD